MFSLSIISGEPPPPEPATAASAAVAVWRDPGGQVCALGEVRPDGSWLHLPGFASYAFGPASNEIRAFPADGVPDDLVRDQYHRTVVPLVLQTRGYGALHASAVRLASGVVAFCALKESGKSTIAYALSRRGPALWADDAVIFELAAAAVTAYSVPFDLRLRAEPARHFGIPEAVRVSASSRRAERPIDFTAAPLAALFVLERARPPAPDPGVSCRPLTAAAAFKAVLAHAYCFQFEGPGKRSMMEQYLSLVARVPVYELRYGSGLAQLPRLLDAIERAAAEAPLERAPTSA